MAKKMLKTIYVRWEYGNDEPWMMAGEDFDGMVDGKTVIGTYQLVETTTAEMVVKRSPAKKAR